MNLYEKFISTFVDYQFEINRYISLVIKNTNNENIFVSSTLVLIIAFLYGLIHAAGPGHGKSIIAFYFLTNRDSYKQAFYMGYLISIIHAFSALIFTFGIFFILETMFRSHFNDYSNITTKISAIIIMIVGLYIIGASSFYVQNNHERIKRNKSKVVIAFGVGIIPCPGVMTIVLYCIMLEKYVLGVFASITMSMGMGFTISIAGILSVILNKKTNSFLQNKSILFERIGGIFIFGLGIVLLNMNSS